MIKEESVSDKTADEIVESILKELKRIQAERELQEEFKHELDNIIKDK